MHNNKEFTNQKKRSSMLPSANMRNVQIRNVPQKALKIQIGNFSRAMRQKPSKLDLGRGSDFGLTIWFCAAGGSDPPPRPCRFKTRWSAQAPFWNTWDRLPYRRVPLLP